MTTPPSDEGQPAKLKKRRLHGACDLCRQKKIRCDSSIKPDNICSNCIAFGAQCTHLLLEARSKVKNPKGTPLEKFDGARSKVTAILAQSYDVPDDRDEVKAAFVELAQYVRALENELANPITVSTPNSAEPSTTILAVTTNDPPAISDDVFLSEHMKRMALDQSEYRFYGKSGNLMLIKAVVEMQRRYFGLKDISKASTESKRPEYWSLPPWQWLPDAETQPLVFPEDDLLHNLIDLYFERANLFYPVFHRPTFEKQLAEGLHLYHYHFGAVVLTMCALASRYSKDPRVFADGATEQNPGWQWFRQVRPIRTSFVHPPSVYELQLYCIYVVHLHCTSTPEASWVLLGNGVRLAQDVGAHRRIPGQTKPNVQSELWKRAFWALVCCDTLLSAFSGRPRATNFEDYDQDLPCDCDDEYWDHPDPDQAFKQPPGKPSKLAFWTEFLKLLRILGVAQRTIYSVGSSKLATEITAPYTDRDAALKIDAALNRWLHELPEYLKWDHTRKEQTFFDQSVMLYTAYNDIRILIHKPFVPSPAHPLDLSGSTDSLGICVESARTIIDVMHIQFKRGYLPEPNIQMYLFNAALILLLIHWRGSVLGKVGDEMDYVRTSIKVLRTYERGWQMAGRLCDILEQFASSEARKRPAQVSSLKRPRQLAQNLPSQPHPHPEDIEQMYNYPILDDIQYAQQSQISSFQSGVSTSAQHPDIPSQFPVHHFGQSIIQPQHFDVALTRDDDYVFDSNAMGMWAKPGFNFDNWFG